MKRHTRGTGCECDGVAASPRRLRRLVESQVSKHAFWFQKNEKAAKSTLNEKKKATNGKRVTGAKLAPGLRLAA
jgi:hypothetical protein